jgi:hypothetical protein
LKELFTSEIWPANGGSWRGLSKSALQALRLLESQLRNLPDRVDEKASNAAESDIFQIIRQKVVGKTGGFNNCMENPQLLSQCSAHYRDSSRTIDKSSRSLLRNDDCRNSYLA